MGRPENTFPIYLTQNAISTVRKMSSKPVKLKRKKKLLGPRCCDGRCTVSASWAMTREGPWKVLLSTCISCSSTTVSSKIRQFVEAYTLTTSRPPWKVGGVSYFLILPISIPDLCTTLTLVLHPSSDSDPGSHSKTSTPK